MRTVLHILTRPEDDLTRELIAQQRARPDTQVEVADLSNATPDYGALVEKIFASDSVQVS